MQKSYDQAHRYLCPVKVLSTKKEPRREAYKKWEQATGEEKLRIETELAKNGGIAID